MKKRLEPNCDLYYPLLIDVTNPNHELIRLEKPIERDCLAEETTFIFSLEPSGLLTAMS